MDSEITDFDKRMALSDGYVACAECGHIITEHNDEDGGCQICMCDVVLTHQETVALLRAYDFPPYRNQTRVAWADDPTDTGTVIEVGGWFPQEDYVGVHWNDGSGFSKVFDPSRLLVVLED